MNWQRSKRLAKHSLRWLNWTLLIPALLLSVMLAALLYTPPGLKLTLWLAGHFVPGLSIQSSSGSLLGGNTLHHLRWQQEGSSVVVEQLSLAFDNRCLLWLALCVDNLHLQGLELVLNSTTQNPAPETTAMPTLWLPMPVSVRRLTLDDVALTSAGHQLNWQHFSTRIEAWGNKIQFSEPVWRHVNLTLAATDNAPAPRRYSAPQLNDFSLPLSVSIQQFVLEDLTMRQQDNHYQLQQLLLSLQWQGADINLSQLELTHKLGSLHSSAHISTNGHYPLTARARLQLSQGELAGQRLQLHAEGSLAALRIDATADGVIAAELQLSADLLDPLLPHQLRFNSNQLHWPVATEAGHAAFHLTDSELTLNGTLQHTQVDGKLHITSADVPEAAINFSGNASLNGITFDTLQASTLNGEVNSPISLSWQQGLSWQGQVRLAEIQPGLFWPDYPGELSGSFRHKGQLKTNGQWQTAIEQLDINGKLRRDALQLTGDLLLADTSGTGDYQFSSSGLTLSHAENRLQLSGSLQQHWQLALQLEIADLAQSIAQAEGQLNGQFNISGKASQPVIKGNIQGTALHFAGLSLQQLSLDGEIQRDAQQHWHSALELSASGGRYQQQQLTQLSARLSGSEQQHQFSLQADAAGHQASMLLDGSFSDNRWQASISQASINSLPGLWQLSAPASLNYQLAQQRLTIGQHCWQQQASALCARAPLTVSASHVSIDLTLTQLALASLTPLLPADNISLSGAIDAALVLNWQQDHPATASLNITGGAGAIMQQRQSTLTLPWQYFSLHSELADHRLSNAVEFNFAPDATLAVNMDIAGLNHEHKPISGEVSLQQFAIDFLQPLLGEFSELSGMLASDLRLSGTLQHPLLHGSTRLQRTRLKGKLAPADIDNADIDLTLSGQTANLNGLITTPKGDIRLTGQADWQQLPDWQAQLSIKGDELRLQIPQARFDIAPDLLLTANPQQTRITGSVHVPAASINIDSLPDSAVELSDDLVLLDAQLQPLPAAQKQTLALQSDINVILGNRVRLSAFGLKTRLSGNLRVRQQAEQPLRVNGDVNLVDGTFRAYGQDLLIRKGKMNFNGPADQPYLNVEAIRNPDNMEDDVIAGIRVSGPADEPSVVVFSEPAKAQASALAYLLMGRDLDSGSGNAGNAVTTSLIGMTLSSSSKVVGEIGEAFGLRDLTLDTAGAGDNAQVTVSGYLSRDLQLKYGYGIFNAVGEFTLRYRLMRRLYLEAVSGLDNAVDLLYKFEFD